MSVVNNIFYKTEVTLYFFTSSYSRIYFKNNHFIDSFCDSEKLIKSVLDSLNFKLFYALNVKNGIINQFKSILTINVAWIEEDSDRKIQGETSSFVIKGQSEFINVSNSSFIRLSSDENGGVMNKYLNIFLKYILTGFPF